MKKTTHQHKNALVSTMVIKSEKDKNYIYTLSNGSTISFESKDFPIGKKINHNSNPNQFLLFN